MIIIILHYKHQTSKIQLPAAMDQPCTFLPLAERWCWWRRVQQTICHKTVQITAVWGRHLPATRVSAARTSFRDWYFYPIFQLSVVIFIAMCICDQVYISQSRGLWSLQQWRYSGAAAANWWRAVTAVLCHYKDQLVRHSRWPMDPRQVGSMCVTTGAVRVC